MSKCLECGYYDKEKHYCPFYCQLIRETLNEAISFELEQIKEEINVNPQVYSDEYFVSVKFVNKVLDNRISELKGD